MAITKACVDAYFTELGNMHVQMFNYLIDSSPPICTKCGNTGGIKFTTIGDAETGRRYMTAECGAEHPCTFTIKFDAPLNSPTVAERMTNIWQQLQVLDADKMIATNNSKFSVSAINMSAVPTSNLCVGAGGKLIYSDIGDVRTEACVKTLYVHEHEPLVSDHDDDDVGKEISTSTVDALKKQRAELEKWVVDAIDASKTGRYIPDNLGDDIRVTECVVRDVNELVVAASSSSAAVATKRRRDDADGAGAAVSAKISRNDSKFRKYVPSEPVIKFGYDVDAPNHLLSNYAYVSDKVEVFGECYVSSEHAFQSRYFGPPHAEWFACSGKLSDINSGFQYCFRERAKEKMAVWITNERNNIGVLAEVAKNKLVGKKTQLNAITPDYNMWEPILQSKFRAGKFRDALLATGNAYLVDDSTSSVKNNKLRGDNMMGKYLMRIRDAIQSETSSSNE